MMVSWLLAIGDGTALQCNCLIVPHPAAGHPAGGGDLGLVETSHPPPLKRRPASDPGEFCSGHSGVLLLIQQEI